MHLPLNMDQLYYQFVWLPTFEHMAKGVLTEEDRWELEGQLLAAPERGVILEGTGRFRKMRVALAGRGKSGGARVIYFFSERRGRIYMALVYPKNERVSLTAAQKQELRRVARLLKGGA